MVRQLQLRFVPLVFPAANSLIIRLLRCQPFQVSGFWAILPRPESDKRKTMERLPCSMEYKNYFLRHVSFGTQVTCARATTQHVSLSSGFLCLFPKRNPRAYGRQLRSTTSNTLDEMMNLLRPSILPPPPPNGVLGSFGNWRNNEGTEEARNGVST